MMDGYLSRAPPFSKKKAPALVGAEAFYDCHLAHLFLLSPNREYSWMRQIRVLISTGS